MAPKWGHVYGARQKFSNSKKNKGEEKQLVLERVDVTGVLFNWNIWP